MAVRRHTPPVSKEARAWLGSIGQHILVVGHRVSILARFVGVRAQDTRWRRSGWPACRSLGAGRRVVPGAEVAERQAGDWRPQAGDGYCLRSDRNKPLRTFEVSTVRADSSRCDCSGRKPRRKASPTWYSTSRAEP